MTDNKLNIMMKNYCDPNVKTFEFKLKQHRGIKAASAIAAAIALVTAVTLLAFNPFKWGESTLRYTVTEYSFREDKLRQLCESDVNVHNVENHNGGKEYEELFQNVGSGISGVVYADAEKVVFTTGRGVFVYDYQKEQMLLTFDLDTLGVPGFNQGDVASAIEVDNKGQYALLISSDNWSDSKPEYEYHKLDFASGEAVQIAQKEIPADFSPVLPEARRYFPKSDSDTAYDLPDSWPSSRMASYINENSEIIGFYTNIERDQDGRVTVGNMDLVIVQPDRSYTTQRVFAGLFPQFQRKV